MDEETAPERLTRLHCHARAASWLGQDPDQRVVAGLVWIWIAWGGIGSALTDTKLGSVSELVASSAVWGGGARPATRAPRVCVQQQGTWAKGTVLLRIRRTSIQI